MSRQFTFGRNERLKSRKQIDLLFSSGKKFSLPPLRVHYIINDAADSPLQFGVGVSNKIFRKAVDRNRVKRLIRECWRLQKIPLQDHLESKEKQLRVFVIYTSREPVSFQELLPAVENLVNKLITTVR